jgi:ATP phosphoribosyltransferase regulatory subunit
MTEPLSKIPDGMRYYFGREARLRRRVEDRAMSVFDGWSYEEISTPAVDYYALFERGMGREAARRAFRFADTDGRLLALRPDVTSTIARAASTLFASRPRPLRLCYSAAVFRRHAPTHAEWRRESSQIGCELIGAGGGAADCEVLAIAAEILTRLGLGEKYCVAINDAEVFNGVSDGLALDAAERAEMRALVDVRDSVALERFLAPRAPAAECAAFARLTRLSGKGETFERARAVITNARSSSALSRLEATWRVVESLGLAERFEVDLGDVSGLDYYTGLTFKIYLEGAGTRVGSGGRYDRLTENFGRAEPAVGFVLDLDALTAVLARSEGSANGDAEGREASEVAGVDDASLFLDATRRRARGERVLLKGREVTRDA